MFFLLCGVRAITYHTLATCTCISLTFTGLLCTRGIQCTYSGKVRDVKTYLLITTTPGGCTYHTLFLILKNLEQYLSYLNRVFKKQRKQKNKLYVRGA